MSVPKHQIRRQSSHTAHVNVFADFLELKQVALDAHKHPRTILRWTNEPDGLPYVKVGNKRLIHPATMRDWLMSRMRRPNPERRRRIRGQ
jgi:hypothetical protein